MNVKSFYAVKRVHYHGREIIAKDMKKRYEKRTVLDDSLIAF